MVPELAILEGELVKVSIHKLAIWMHNARIEMVRVQLELNLEITELQVKAQPSTLSEVKDQRANTVIEAIAMVDSAVADYTQAFEKLFKVLMSL